MDARGKREKNQTKKTVRYIIQYVRMVPGLFAILRFIRPKRFWAFFGLVFLRAGLSRREWGKGESPRARHFKRTGNLGLFNIFKMKKQLIIII